MSDSNEYPKALYKCPGPIKFEQDTHDTITVASADEEAAAVTGGGWHPDLPAARAAHAAALAAEAAAAEAEAPADAPPADPAPTGKKKG